MKKLKILTLILAAAAASSALSANVHAIGVQPSKMTALCGDVNGDGIVTSDDALFTLRNAVDLEEKPDEADFRLLDVDSDGVITSADAMMILRESVGLGSFGRDSGNDTIEMKNLPDPTSAPEAINRFSEQLMKAYCKENNNDNVVVMSPLSVYYAFAMLENGANKKTQKEILDVLYKGADEQKLNSELSTLLEEYNSDGSARIANAVYVTDRDDVVIGEEFKECVQKYYSSDIFVAPPKPETREMLNDWISLKTSNMINEAISPADFKEDTNSILINALYFKSAWVTPYNESQIYERSFTDINGNTIRHEFLNDRGYVFYEDDNACAFRRKYEGNYSFIGILPNEDVGVDGYISSMNGNTIQDLLENPVYGYDVRTAIPKMDLECEFKLKETMKDMGIREAFDVYDADLKRIATMYSDRNISVGSVLHKTKLVLDEDGTEAAAATVIICTDAETSAVDTDPTPVKIINLDRPFIFVIYDESNDIPLFIGAVKTLG